MSIEITHKSYTITFREDTEASEIRERHARAIANRGRSAPAVHKPTVL